MNKRAAETLREYLKDERRRKAKNERLKEITREIVEHGFVYRCWLTRVFEEEM